VACTWAWAIISWRSSNLGARVHSPVVCVELEFEARLASSGHAALVAYPL
jgi:hypothetical protein